MMQMKEYKEVPQFAPSAAPGENSTSPGENTWNKLKNNAYTYSYYYRYNLYIARVCLCVCVCCGRLLK